MRNYLSTKVNKIDNKAQIDETIRLYGSEMSINGDVAAISREIQKDFTKFATWFRNK